MGTAEVKVGARPPAKAAKKRRQLDYLSKRAGLPDYGLDYRVETSRVLFWFVPGVVATWIFVIGMTLILRQRPLQPPNAGAVEARLVELLPPSPPPAPMETHEAVPAKPLPKPPVQHARTEPPAKKVLPHVSNNTPRLEGAPVTNPNSAIAMPERPALPSVPSESGVAGSEESGPGSDTAGARAIYAPQPKIPDELRENILQTEAVARFTVSPDGDVTVALVKATENPRLNQILLQTLQQWRFFPAMKDGVAIASEIEVRIPISIQ